MTYAQYLNRLVLMVWNLHFFFGKILIGTDIHIRNVVVSIIGRK